MTRSVAFFRLWPLLGICFIAGCGPGGAISVRLAPTVERPKHGVVLFICDGMCEDLFEQGCREGWLPNFQKRFVAGGTGVTDAITGVPSITYPILTTYTTGVEPVRHGIIANEWFDPRLSLSRRYITIDHYRDVNGDFCYPTIYERMSPKVSMSIQDPVHVGVTRNISNWAGSGVRWFLKDYTAVDKLTASTIDFSARWANRHGVWPDLLVCYFPAVDTVGHRNGVDSRRYRESIEHLDYQVGRICDWLEAEELLDTTTLILVADHGLAPVGHDGYVELEKIIRCHMKRRLKVMHYQDTPIEDRSNHFNRYDAVLVRSAVRFATVHFAGRLGWNDPLPPEEVRAILNMPPEGRRFWDLAGVDLVAFLTSDNAAELRSTQGTARVESRQGDDGPEFRYVPSPDDIFGYLQNERLASFVAKGFHAPREWLAATCEETYPDVVPRLIPLLHHPRTGQVVLFAARGYSFGNQASGHGGIHRDEMRIPMCFAGPGIPAGGRIPLAHATDIAPTIMDCLGCEVSDGEMDGRSLLEEIKKSTQTP